jgi:lactoylglutathione lyase
MTTASLRLIVLKTRDLDKLKAFYEALGITFAKEQHGKGPMHYAGQLGTTVLELYPLPHDITVADTTTRLGFCVGSLKDVLTRLGATVAVVRDPDGRTVELYQEGAVQ